MKTFFAACLYVCIASNAFAQTAPQPTMTPEQAQQAAQQMQKCLTSIGQQAMMKMQKQAQALSADIRMLCHQDKRDEANALALKEGMKLAESPEIQKLAKCSQQMQTMMNPYVNPMDPTQPRQSDVCGPKQ